MKNLLIIDRKGQGALGRSTEEKTLDDVSDTNGGVGSLRNSTRRRTIDG